MNDNRVVGKIVASKIALAVWGDKAFNKEDDPIRLRDESREDKIMKTLKAKGLVR